MLKKAVPNLKRWVSGYLVAVMTLMLVFNNSFAFSALAAETASGSNAEKEASASDAFKNSKVSLKNSQKEDVQFLIFSEQSSYEPGETVCLDLYIKNNTDKTITDGLLKIARAKGIEKDSAYFEDMTDLYEAANREEEKPEETTAEETKAEETEEGTSAEEKEELTAESSEEIGLESAETPEITEVAENVEDLLPTESESAVSKEENLGTEVADTEAAEIKDTAAPEPTAETIEREAEETIEEGSVAVEDEESSASAEDEISEDDEEEKEEEEDPERLSELEILPGKTAYINFYYTIDPEIEGMKDQKVDFSFAYTLEDEEGKQTKNTLRETFRYAVDALNLMTVTAGGEKGYVETGKEDEMLLEFDLGLMREVLEEAIEEELEKTENGDASAAEAKRASASELLVGWEDENGERPLGKKDPAVIKNLKCEVETFGVKLDKFKAIPVKDDDNFGTSLKCSFYVSRKTLPGTYYGRVNASYKIKGKSFHTTQGFKVVVKQETGEMELVGKIGDSEIIMTGPVSSFPKADELSLKVSEITQEQQEKVDEALQKKAEEEGTEISQYKALDIKLMADGVETEPEGDVQVRFKNVNLEKVDEKKEAEQEKAEEQSIVKKAVRKVMSLFSDGNEEEDAATVAETETEVEAENKDSEDGKAEGSEEAAGETGETAENSENIKVLHLDEDAIVANEMKSEVQDNGDVVMDTDHFSVYIVVNVPDGPKEIHLTVEHHAMLERMQMENGLPVEKPTGVNPNPTGDTAYEIEVSKHKGTTLSPGAAYPDNPEGERYIKEDWQIYSTDEIMLPNGAGTGIDYEIAVKNWSKVTLGGHYDVDYVEFNGTKYYENDEQKIINLTTTNNNLIKIYYKPKSNDTIQAQVEFHDYNVTIEGDNTENEPKHSGIRTNRVGMNNIHLNEGIYNESTSTTSNRIGVGIYHNNDENANNSIWHDYSGAWNWKHKQTGVTKNNLVEGEISFTKADPGLFTKGPIFTHEIYKDGTTITNYEAKRYISDYKLEFKRKGDNYVLSKVLDANGKTIDHANNLDVLKYTTVGWSSQKALYSNVFWPMDEVNYSNSERGKTCDPLFGGNYGFGTNDENAIDPGVKHNWYFGMRYDFAFTIGDYTGPMDYHFRGDDDFWLFMDGKLVENVDIGGIHAAEGAYVDLDAWMKDPSNGIDLSDPNKPHQMSVFFMERGGTGSCCYMNFTLPNAMSIPPSESELTSRTVEKKWLDKDFENRSEVVVQLYQDKVPFGEPVTLKAENNWKHTWLNLTKFSNIGGNEDIEFDYTIKEVYSIPGYEPNISESGNEFIITNVRHIDIPVTKIWEDEDNKLNSRPDEIKVQLFKRFVDFKSDAAPISTFSENEKWTPIGDEISLSESNTWKYIWKNKPLYEKNEDNNWQKVIYSIKEVQNDCLKPGEGCYEAEYKADTENGFTITNTFKISGEIPLRKKCIGLTEGETESFTFEIREMIRNDDGSFSYKDINSSESTDFSYPTIDITVSDENGNTDPINRFIIDYKSEDIGTPEADGCWYKWYEVYEKNNGGNFIYDNSHYIVKIKISREGLKYTACWVMDDILKDGQPFYLEQTEDKELALPFVNYKKVDLEVTKKLEGNISTTKMFGFTATIKIGTEIFKLPIIGENAAYSVDDEGLIHFELSPNGSAVKIPVPIGSTVTIEENEASHAGYNVKFEVNNKTTEGSVVEIPNITSNGSSSISVICTNTPGAVLPDTGGPGLLMMSRLGWMLLLLALLMAGMEIQFYGERRNRKTANVQREDSRGFDPDDY